MNAYRQLFTKFYEDFKNDPLYDAMRNTVENSPYHREANVAVHTDMVVEQYIERTKHVDWNVDYLKGALVCVFHDIGKPDAKEECTSEERGTYFRFLGHELISARLAEDYMVRNWTIFKGALSAYDIYCIGWLIEHHLPYNIVKVDKRSAIKQTVNRVLCDSPEVFEHILLADQHGRISDDHDTKKRNADEWITDFRGWKLPEQSLDLGSTKRLIMLVGPSGVGKSTFTELYQSTWSKPVHVFSWDALRLEKYPYPFEGDDITLEERYEYAFLMSCDDSTFYPETLRQFSNLTKLGVDIIVDNMNLSDKRRKQLAEVAAKRGYFVEMVLFPISIDKLMERAATRVDKRIRDVEVRDMYMRLSYPTFNNYCHSVTVCRVNI